MVVVDTDFLSSFFKIGKLKLILKTLNINHITIPSQHHRKIYIYPSLSKKNMPRKNYKQKGQYSRKEQPPKKNQYLTPQEQQLWHYIQDKEIIDNELVKDIFPEIPPNLRNKLLHSLYKKHYLKRARKDLYFTQNLKDFHKLALRMQPGYIGLNSALRFYNLLEYEDFTIFIMTKDTQKNIDIKGTQYTIKCIPIKNLFIGFHMKDSIPISTIEKTIFDCLLKPSMVGFTNLTKAIYQAKINWHIFISYFKETTNHALCQRTGYILELMLLTTKLKVPKPTLDFLAKKVKHPVKLSPLKNKSTFNKKWKIQDNLGKALLSWWYAGKQNGT